MKKLLILCLFPFNLHAQDSTWKKTVRFKYLQFNMIQEQADTIGNVLKKAFDVIPFAGASYQILNQSSKVITVYDSVKVADTIKRKK